MPIRFTTPAGSPTASFAINLNSPVVGFDSGTPMPEDGTAAIRFTTPAGSPTRSFAINLNSPVVGF